MEGRRAVVAVPRLEKSQALNLLYLDERSLPYWHDGRRPESSWEITVVFSRIALPFW